MEHTSIAEQLSQVVGDVSTELNDAGKATERAAKKALGKTRDASAQALEVSADTLVQGQELMRNGYKRSLDLFRKYPVESAVACLGAGFLVGKILNSRH